MLKFKNKTYEMVVVGIMAAMVFVTSFFLKIEIPTPAGPTMLKVGNIMCLLSGILFGGLYGGLAAGIGSMFFDLMNPAFVSGAPITLVFFFIMGFICGKISHARNYQGQNMRLNVLAAACGAGSYFVLHISKSILELMFAGSAFIPAVLACSTKMITSGLNGIIAIICSVMIAKPLHHALVRAGIYKKMTK